MMVSNPYKKLGGQALIYGLGNIVPRILNYAILTFYYTRRFPPEKYGVITELYAYVAILLVVLTYGMETGLFKFSTHSFNKEKTYSSILLSVVFTSCLFALGICFFKNSIAQWIGYTGNPDFVLFLGMTLSIDAISSIVFAKLRIDNRVRRFAILKIVNVLVTIMFVFLFLELLPEMKFITQNAWYITNFKNVDVGYVFIANMLSSLVILLLQVSDLIHIRFKIDFVLLRKILFYAVPLLISGLAGIFNDTIDRILLRQFSDSTVNSLYELGIYGANYRIAVLMTIFVQMFRYAAEPFFFNWAGKSDAKEVYSNILKYFTIFLMMIFLGVGLGIDFFKLFIDKDYYEGLGIVPIVLMANVLVGLLFNVNMWYKLSGHTMYGVYITGTGALITVILNILFIPKYGYWACAWVHLLSNAVMLFLTYSIGQKIFKITYDLKSIGLYMSVGLLLFFFGIAIRTKIELLNIFIGALIVIVYFLYCNRREDLLGIFLKKHESKNY